MDFGKVNIETQKLIEEIFEDIKVSEEPGRVHLYPIASVGNKRTGMTPKMYTKMGSLQTVPLCPDSYCHYYDTIDERLWLYFNYLAI